MVCTVKKRAKNQELRIKMQSKLVASMFAYGLFMAGLSAKDAELGKSIFES